MAIASTIKEGATTVAASGGTDVTLVSLGLQGNTNLVTFSTDVSNLLRRLLSFFCKPEQVSPNAPGGFTQRRSTVMLKVPKVLANGNRTMNTAQYQLSYDPETTDAEIEAMNETMSQVIGTAAFQDFYKRQNLN